MIVQNQDGTYCQTGSPARPDISAQEREAQERARWWLYEDLKKAFGDPESFRWCLEHQLLGTVYTDTNKPRQVFGIVNPLSRPRDVKYFDREVVVSRLAELRAIVAALPKGC